MARSKKLTQVEWKSKPDAHDYPAAGSYLSLLVADAELRRQLVGQLQDAPVVSYQAKDLLRASQLPPLTKANAHVAIDLKKIRKRLPLSPVLLVRGDLAAGFPLQIADGYHRICASHLVDEDTAIPCRMIDLPAKAAARRAPARTAVAPAAPVAVEAPPVAVEATPVAAAAVSKTVVTKSVPARKAPARKAAPRKSAPRNSAAGA